MNQRRSAIIALLVFGLSSSVVSGALADRGHNGSRGNDWNESGGRRSGAWNSWDTRERRGSERSYYYEDPYCGTRSSHVSDFKQHYGRARHAALILKVDIRSGRVTDRYRYDRNEQEWRDWDRRSRSCDDDDRDHRNSRSRDRDD